MYDKFGNLVSPKRRFDKKLLLKKSEKKVTFNMTNYDPLKGMRNVSNFSIYRPGTKPWEN